MTQKPFDRSVIKQIGIVFCKQLHSFFAFNSMQCQVKFRNTVLYIRDNLIRSCCFLFVHFSKSGIVERKHDLKKRIKRRVSLRLNEFNQFFKRHFIVFLCSIPGLFYGIEQIFKAVVFIKLTSYNQGVCEKPNQVF
ncbi:hypothetical protein D3C71_691640 [compost metagenome]